MSTANTSRGVPGIPLGALDAVSDENARLVLQSIIDGLNVRNGFSGAGDMAFVTRSEMEGSQGAMALGLSRQMQSYTDQIRQLGPGQINAVINDLQAQIMESKLFKDLGERVNLIDKPGGIFERLGTAETTLIEEQTLRVSGDEGLSQRINVMGVRVDNAEVVITNEVTQRINGDTALSTRIDQMGTRVGTAEAAISTETTQRVNADNAIQQTISTQYAAVNNNLSLLQSSQTTTANNVAALTTAMQQVQAQVGANAVAIQQETQARAAADGTLYAQWTLRVDVAGRVSGFGLASDANVSDFIVRADRFSIASPSVQSGINPQMPFIVTTTPQIVNGRSVQPGVYIRDAFIENGTITSAKIGIAEVDTLTIRGNAVTIPVYSEVLYETPAIWNSNGTYVELASVTLTLPPNSGVLVFVSCIPGDKTGGTHPANYKITVEGSVMDATTIATSSITMPNNAGSIIHTWFAKHTTPDIGQIGETYFTYKFWGTQEGDVNGFFFWNRRIMVMGAKR